MEPSQRAETGPAAAWLPAYLVVLLAASLTPLSYSSVAGPIWLSPLPGDALANVLAYLPLGWALSRRPARDVLLAALCLSVGVELAQQYMIRTPSPWDVAANLVGSWIGARVLPLGGPLLGVARRARRLAWLGLPLSLVLLVLLGQAVARAPMAVPANWQQGTLWLGWSPLADAPLAGSVRELRVFDHFPRGLGSSWSSGGPTLRLDVAAGTLTLDGPEGRRALPWPAQLARSDGGALLPARGVQLPAAAAEHVIARSRATGSIAVWASFEAAPPHAGRAAAVFALAGGSGGSLFTMLRDGPGVALRVPAPGDASRSFGPGALLSTQAKGPRGVLASYDGHWARVVVDGSLGHQSYLPARLSPWPIGSGVTLSSVLVVLLAATGAGGLWRRARSRPVAMLMVAGAAHAGLWGIGLLPLHSGPLAAAAVSALAALASLPFAAALGPSAETVS